MNGTIKAPSENSPIIGTVNTGYYTTMNESAVKTVMRIGNIVFINLAISFNSGIRSGAFAQVPAGFRPKQTVAVPMVMRREDDGRTFPYAAYIGADGLISQQVSGSMQYISVSGFYTV